MGITSKKLKLNKRKSYLAMIKNSQGNKMFANYFVFKNKKNIDILKSGRLSCAFFVSSILRIFNLVSSVHLTVLGLLKDLEKNNWQEEKNLKIGDILLWEKKDNHFHIGFYLGDKKAISNSSEKKTIVMHHYTFEGKRKIIKILRSYGFK